MSSRNQHGSDATCLLVMTDGRRECLQATLERAREMLRGTIVHRMIHDDSADESYTNWLRHAYADFEVVATGKRSGFGGAIQSAWRHLPDCRYVLHLEDDFLIQRVIDVKTIAQFLDGHPYLAQMAFRRQPVSPGEAAVGGFVELFPQTYTHHDDGRHRWLEHTNFFTTNPCLYRRDIISVGWPDGEDSERQWSYKLLERGLPWGIPGSAVRMGFWETMETGRDWAWHIGDVRMGTGY